MNCNNQLGPTNTPNSPNTREQAITDLYMQDGDDYYIDDTAFSEAQTGTGDNETVASVAGSSSGGASSGGASETNSNVNTGVFGGLAHAAKPGESLWK